MPSSRPLKICIVGSYPPNTGGEAVYVHNYISALKRYVADQISEIHVLSHNRNSVAEKKQSNSSTDDLKIYRIYNTSNSISKNLSFLKIFIKILQINPDVVHFEYSPLPKPKGYYGGLLGEPLLILFLMLRLIRKPFIVTLHTMWWPDQVEERFAELTGRKLFSKPARYYFEFFTYLLGSLPHALFLLVPKSNPKLLEKFAKTYHIRPDKIREELHGMWLSDNNSDKRSGPISKKIVCLGVMSPVKGYEHVIRAMKDVIKKHPNSFLLIAGAAISEEGKNYIKKLQSLVSEYSLDDCVSIEERYLSDSEFDEQIKSAGIVVLPYNKSISASSIMSLAITYRVPIIIGNTGPWFEQLSDLFPASPKFDHDILAQNIIKTLDSEAVRDELVKRYGDYFSENDWSLVVKSLFREYVNVTRR